MSTANETVPLAYALSLATQASWSELSPGLRLRELGLRSASNGRLRDQILAIDQPVTAHGLEAGTGFEFFFLIEGSLELVTPTGTLHFDAQDAAWQLPLSQASELRPLAPAHVLRIFGDLDLPVETTISRRAEARMHGKGGPRDFFAYREFGVAETSRRRADVQVLSATRPREGGTGWHSHTMSQMFIVLAGEAVIESREGMHRLAPGDAMCLPFRMPHNVPSFTADYALLQIQFPADYETQTEAAYSPDPEPAHPMGTRPLRMR